MEKLILNKTNNTPQVEFHNDGKMSIIGRAMNEDPRMFFTPLMKWVGDLTTDSVNLEVKLDYLNTSSTKMMNEFIKTIDANSKIRNKIINWYFEEDDEDMLEVGQILEENTFTTSFFFHQMAESPMA